MTDYKRIERILKEHKFEGLNIFSVLENQAALAIEMEEQIRKLRLKMEVGREMGLGLSICQGIVEKHNGLISVKSEVGKGSVFTVQLPKAKVGIEVKSKI